MAAERSVISSVLKLTGTGCVPKELIQRDAKVTQSVVEENLRKLLEGGFIRQQRGLIAASPDQRVSLAVQAVKLGADFERICKFLEWSEFEGIVAEAFLASGFKVLKNFRFKRAGKRWEIDVLGCREPLVVCVDCKHWRRGWSQAATIKAVEAQVERTRAFAEALSNYYEKAGLTRWKSATLVPIVLSLVPSPFKFHRNVPIVPVLQLPDFLYQMPGEVDSLTYFKKKLQPIQTKFNRLSK